MKQNELTNKSKPSLKNRTIIYGSKILRFCFLVWGYLHMTVGLVYKFNPYQILEGLVFAILGEVITYNINEGEEISNNSSENKLAQENNKFEQEKHLAKENKLLQENTLMSENRLVKENNLRQENEFTKENSTNYENLAQENKLINENKLTNENSLKSVGKLAKENQSTLESNLSNEYKFVQTVENIITLINIVEKEVIRLLTEITETAHQNKKNKIETVFDNACMVFQKIDNIAFIINDTDNKIKTLIKNIDGICPKHILSKIMDNWSIIRDVIKNLEMIIQRDFGFRVDLNKISNLLKQLNKEELFSKYKQVNPEFFNARTNQMNFAGKETNFSNVLETNENKSLFFLHKLKERINFINKLELLNFLLNEKQIYRLFSNLTTAFLFVDPKLLEKGTYDLSVSNFNDYIISRVIKKKLGKFIRLRNIVLDNVILKIIDLYSKDIYSGQDFKIDHEILLKLIWENSIEKKNYEISILNKKHKIEQENLKQKKEKIENDLFWLQEKSKKYISETLKIKFIGAEAKAIIDKMYSIVEDLEPNLKSFGKEKLEVANTIVTQLIEVSNKLIEQEISFNIAAKRLDPKIKDLLTDFKFKEAEKLLIKLLKIYDRIHALGTQFKDLFENLKQVKEKLLEKKLQQKILIDNQQKREERKNNREKQYFDICIEKISQAEEKLKALEEKCLKREINKDRKDQKSKLFSNLTQKQPKYSQKNMFQSQKQIDKVKEINNDKGNKDKGINNDNDIDNDKLIVINKEIINNCNKPENDTDSKINEKSNNSLSQFMTMINEQNIELQNLQNELNKPIHSIELNAFTSSFDEINIGSSFTLEERSDSNNKKINNLTLSSFNIESQLKAREELMKLQIILQEIVFADQNAIKRDIYYCKLERACIMGIVARAMECYKNIPGNNFSSVRRNNNFLKVIAKTFRDAAFHCFSEKLFNQPGEDFQKNIEINKPFIDMGCKILAFLNDPKWQKRPMTKEDILECFKDKSKENDLFIKICNFQTSKTPTALECKEQILLGRKEVREFMNLKDCVPELMYNVAIGFCEARIGCFASELINHPLKNNEDKIYRQTFNELRFEYKIPLGQYIQNGIAFRHLLNKLSRDKTNKKSKLIS